MFCPRELFSIRFTFKQKEASVLNHANTIIKNWNKVGIRFCLKVHVRLLAVAQLFAFMKSLIA